MKTKIYAMMALTLPLLASCFSDDSNYDYADALDIQVEGIQEQYTVSAGDVVQLHPTVTPANRDYDCFWTRRQLPWTPCRGSRAGTTP